MVQLESLHWKPHILTLLAAPQVASDGPNPAGGAEKWSHCCVESSEVSEMANSQETSRQQVSNQTSQLASVNWDVCSHPSETREAERLANVIFYRSEMSTCASSNVRQQAHFWLNTLITTCKTPVVMMLGLWCHLNWAVFSLYYYRIKGFSDGCNRRTTFTSTPAIQERFHLQRWATLY